MTNNTEYHRHGIIIFFGIVEVNLFMANIHFGSSEYLCKSIIDFIGWHPQIISMLNIELY